MLDSDATPINDDPNIVGQNAGVVTDCVMADILANYASAFRGQDLLVLFGDDFRYGECTQGTRWSRERGRRRGKQRGCGADTSTLLHPTGLVPPFRRRARLPG